MKEMLIKSANLSEKLNDEIREYLKNIFESSNINFLIGAGYSAGILKTLGNIESILEILQKKNNEDYKFLEAITLWRFFTDCIYPINDVISDNEKLEKSHYFLRELFNLIEKRGNTVYRKKVNIFTTNYDPFIEISFEKNRIEYNDGFLGRIDPYFCTANYNRIIKKCTLFSDKESDFPMFNLFKLHGSTTWEVKSNDDMMGYQNIESANIIFKNKYSSLFEPYNDLSKEFSVIQTNEINEKKIEEMNIKLQKKVKEYNLDMSNINSEGIGFINEYKEQFRIVNPTKEKFNNTVFNKTYYELLRVYSNELEKQNSTLLVFGFSFADEHILEITQRSLNNPTLQMIIFSYRKEAFEDYKKKFDGFRNITIIGIDDLEIDETLRMNEEAITAAGEICSDKSGSSIIAAPKNNRIKQVIDLEKLTEIFSSILL
ncbi:MULTISPECIES: SIR2 family protein [unclassified Clostridium]|uniref:SIR2 family protein n=1 Tax=unclassified Clostridium TaxID=2614128 RepID=UPI0025B97339|nr:MULTISPECIES: SIR2 family protein [unclassified Clostridium]